MKNSGPLIMQPMNFGINFLSEIDKRNWEEFCLRLGLVGRLDLVCEFSSNTFELQSNTIWVLKSPISLTSISVNRIFGIPNILYSEFTKFDLGDINIEEVIDVVTKSMGTWSKSTYRE
ncbi:hypothetical protein ACH5RR_018185 [Cinchona calisaya]|uniref:Uncharacterized protein n=1 Tax=Cinchona calisaya TaxID=153742 RepID=A0ABD2ZKV6_9GENT